MRRRAATLSLALGVLALAVGCGGEPSAPPQIYQVRGEVYQLPDPDRSPRTIYLRHEAIPDFVDRDGNLVGMDAMTMSFRLADHVSVEGLEPGDLVEFTLEVHWQGPPTQVTRLARREEAVVEPSPAAADGEAPADAG